MRTDPETWRLLVNSTRNIDSYTSCYKTSMFTMLMFGQNMPMISKSARCAKRKFLPTKAIDLQMLSRETFNGKAFTTTQRPSPVIPRPQRSASVLPRSFVFSRVVLDLLADLLVSRAEHTSRCLVTVLCSSLARSGSC